MSSIKDFELAQRIHVATVQLQAEIVTLRNAAVLATERAERAEAAAASARTDEEQAIARADKAEAERDLLLDEIEALNLPVPFGPQNGKAWHEAVQESLDALRADAERLRQKLPEILGVLAGAASLCWEPRPTGVFDSSLASMFVDRALKECDAVLAAMERKP